jgi:hypothetical protein
MQLPQFMKVSGLAAIASPASRSPASRRRLELRDEAPSPRAFDWPPLNRGFTVAHYLSLAAALIVLLYLDRHQWFYYDEWDYLADRGTLGHSRGLFFPHSEHWQTIPILVYRGLFALFGLRTYLPYILVVIVLHLAIAHLLWRLLLRCGADGWVATALVGVFLLLGAGYENLTWAFQMGFLTSILCGIATMLLTDQDRAAFGRRDLLVWGIATAGIMSSGIGLTMLAATGVVALLRRGWRATLLTVAAPLVVYIVWLAAIGRSGFTGTHVTRGSLLLIPDYVWRGLTNTLDAASGLTGFGAVALVGLLVWMLYRHRLAAEMAPAFAAAAGAAAFFFLTAVARSAYGPGEATSSRYVYIGTVLLIPIIAVVTTRLARTARVAQMGVVLIAVFALGHNLSALVSHAREEAALKQERKQQILAGAQLISSGARLIGGQPDPLYAPDLSTPDLALMLHRGALPPLNGLSETDRLSAVLALQVDLQQVAQLPASPDVVARTGAGGFLQPAGAGCVHATSYGGNETLTLRFAEAGSVRIHSPSNEQVSAVLVSPDGKASGPRTFVMPADGTAFLSAVIPATINLSLPPDGLEVCGVGPASSGSA